MSSVIPDVQTLEHIVVTRELFMRILDEYARSACYRVANDAYLW
jgi:hypothetical protein